MVGHFSKKILLKCRCFQGLYKDVEKMQVKKGVINFFLREQLQLFSFLWPSLRIAANHQLFLSWHTSHGLSIVVCN